MLKLYSIVQIQREKPDARKEMVQEEPQGYYQPDLEYRVRQERLKPGIFLRGIEHSLEAGKEQGNSGKKQQQATHPMQDRNHCGERLPDFQKVEVLGAFFLQFFITYATDQFKFRPL